MTRARIICKCDTCLELIGPSGCSFSSSGHAKHLGLIKRKIAEESARGFFNAVEVNQGNESVGDYVQQFDVDAESTITSDHDEYCDDTDIIDDDIPLEVLEDILQDREETEDEDDPADDDDAEQADFQGHYSSNNGDNNGQGQYDPFLPKHPVAFVLFILVVLFYGRYVSDHGLEIMMGCFSVILDLLSIPYRFPRRVEQLKRWIQEKSDVQGGSKEYVLCKNCSSIYPYQTQEEKDRMHRHNKCKFKDTLLHSHKCSTPLFEEIKMRNISDDNSQDNGSDSTSSISKYVPLKRFYYNSLIYTLRSFVKRDGFTQMLRNTFAKRQSSAEARASSNPMNFMSDVQDGDVYQKFSLRDDGVPFTKESPYNLMLLLNLDWLSPFELSSYSVGGVWISILNLDHSDRIMRSNTILSCILPGSREATQMEMTRLLKPLIDELQALKDGVLMVDSDGDEVLIRACLCLVSADLPAIRKVMGVAAHNALYSCGFCDHQFDSCENNQRDYSNLDIDSYSRRTKQTHHDNSLKWQDAKTQTERDEIKKSTGTAYSILQELSYFDCIEFQAVDILHCAYLGIAKRMIRTIWLNIGCTVEDNVKLLSNGDLKDMSKLLDGFVFPLDPLLER